MEAFVARFLAATRKSLFRSKPIFESYRNADEADLAEIERHVGVTLPPSLRVWLLRAGFGDLNEEISFRAEWFSAVDRGPLKGHVIFAQDIGGNFYSFGPGSGAIHFISQAPVFDVVRLGVTMLFP